MNKGGQTDRPGYPSENTGEAAEDKDKNTEKQKKGQKGRKTLLSSLNRPLLGFEFASCCVDQCRGTRYKTSVKISLLKSRLDDLIDNSSCHQIC
jgi:hypothetical protein